MLREGGLDEREVEIELRAVPVGLEIMGPYMDAARIGSRRTRSGIEVRLQSYIRPTLAEPGSAWP
jgi:hypothetical protein